MLGKYNSVFNWKYVAVLVNNLFQGSCNCILNTYILDKAECRLCNQIKIYF